MPELFTKQLFGKPQEMADLQNVLEEAPEYSVRVSGRSPSLAEAQNVFTALPHEKDYYDDKFVLGLYLDSNIFGCADIIRGYPNSETATIGLLLVSEKHQGQGLGRIALERIENFCLTWPEIKKARVGIVDTNASVLPFWKKMGFKETGERKPYKNGDVKCEATVLEKVLR